jgi:hypothetical protein
MGVEPLVNLRHKSTTHLDTQDNKFPNEWMNDEWQLVYILYTIESVLVKPHWHAAVAAYNDSAQLHIILGGWVELSG